jgi:hypothetical protein
MSPRSYLHPVSFPLRSRKRIHPHAPWVSALAAVALRILPAISQGASPSGQAMPVGDIQGWHQIFADDFTTNVPIGSFPAAVSDKWSAYPDGWKDTSGYVYRMPSKTVSIANGMLDIYVHTENGQHMAAAIEPKIPTGGQTYGRYSVRFRSDAITGYGCVWLLWQDSDTPAWPAQGEIDFPEGSLTGTMNAYAHHADPGGSQEGFATTTIYPGWHTATTEWSPGKVVFILDDHVIGVSTTLVPSTSMHYVLQAGSSGGNPPDSSSGHIQIDWVTLYAPSTTSTGGALPTRTYETEGLTVLGSSGDTVRDFTDSQMSNGAGNIIDATAAGDYVTYMVPSVAAGTYSVRVGAKKYNTRGIFQLSVSRADGGTTSNVGAATDQYTATATYPEMILGNWTCSSSSDKAFKFSVTGKNASSTGYGLAFDYIKLVPQ